MLVWLTLILGQAVLCKETYLTLHNDGGDLKAAKATTREKTFKRVLRPEKSFSKTSSVIVQGESTYSYGRTVLADQTELAELFNDDDDIYIFKQVIGQSKRFLFLYGDEKPDNYERPSDFDDGDFQLLTLSHSNDPMDLHKTFRISLCKFDDNYQLRKHGECGKKWNLVKYYFVYSTPVPGTRLVYVGSRDTKPWDSRVSLKSLDGSPFVRNQFTMHVKVSQKYETDSEDNDEYERIYHYTSWTTKYSAENTTIHHYSKEPTPPPNFVKAEYGARSVPAFAVPFKGQTDKDVRRIYICEKTESKAVHNEDGNGIVISKRRALSEQCSKGYIDVGSFDGWRTQADAPKDAVNIFVTKKKKWPFDTLTTFTFLGKSDEYKPAFSFWAIPLQGAESDDGFVKNSGLVVSGIRSDRMTVEWRKDPFIKSYNITVTPQPDKMTEFGIMNSNRLRLKGLTANTKYTISVAPTTSSGIELDAMVTSETTAPIPDDVHFPMIRSTELQIILPDVAGAEDYRIKINPEVTVTSQDSSVLTVETKPATQYSVSLVVVMSKAKDIQTSEISRTVKTSPGVEQLNIDMEMASDGVDVFVNGLEKEARGYQFKVANADTPSGRIDEIKTTNSINLTGLKNNDMVEVEVSIMLPDNGFEQRATDFVRISTPYKICAWSPTDSKLSCSGRNDRVKAEIVSWTVNKDNMVNVRTAAANSTQIQAKDVEILNIDQNRIGRKEFEQLVARFPNLQRINAADNVINALSVNTFKNNKHLWKIDLSNNGINQLPADIFNNLPSLQVLDMSFNPLDYCGLGLAQVGVLETKLRQLDIRGTRFPENLVGHWNALMLYYDVGDEPEIIHRAIFPQLCPLQ